MNIPFVFRSKDRCPRCERPVRLHGSVLEGKTRWHFVCYEDELRDRARAEAVIKRFLPPKKEAPQFLK